MKTAQMDKQTADKAQLGFIGCLLIYDITKNVQVPGASETLPAFRYIAS